MEICKLELVHKADWFGLWNGYLQFYKKDLAQNISEIVFAKLCDEANNNMGGIIAYEGEKAVGIANYIIHGNTWSDKNVCYLEDLFTSEDCRGKGVGRALIMNLRDYAQIINCRYLYWQTAQDNKTAQALYNKVGYDTKNLVYKIDL